MSRNPKQSALQPESIAAVRARRAHSVKWQRYPLDVVPAWVADMDFPPPAQALESGIELLRNGDTGYPSSDLGSSYEAAYQHWCKESFGTQPHPLKTVADVVAALRIVVLAVTDPGAGVIVLTPSYPPFFNVVKDAQRELMEVPMSQVDQQYRVDLERLATAAADPRAQAIILCNPQNPTGRIFTKSELADIATIADREHLTVIADEIHQDLLSHGSTHVPFASLENESATRAIVLSSPSKSFNIAGLKVAHIELPSDRAQRARLEASPLLALSQATPIGLAVGAEAYETQRSWLDEVRHLIDDNFTIMEKSYASNELVSFTHREGTYLLWGELHRLPEGQSAYQFLLDRGRLGVGAGEDYLPGAPEFFRLNLAAWPSTITAIMERINDALGTL
ncbi:aminotransferase class I/II-fold pyridoxal phosphate-dependent enzyme [Ferrimicrobium sp.]|uniref:MalY/PatB family protein n=1 Tax=Ferrimicrobium sp. TaxID=2926050 RepID=UPI00262BB732|nr:aminotransferase class I/II-fold pyridoxal phosphate-dependent enzyme [Ferrimicrobium sp.]